jgi:asparagine synthase (glutamine-hydrolysing)
MFRLLLALVLTTSASFVSPFSEPDVSLLAAPLMSQPVVDLALRIPTYLHTHGGIDRSVGRHAFQQDLTDLVLNRGTGKGTPETWIRDAIASNRTFMREILLDGVLVRMGFLDKAKLEHLLSGEINKNMSYISEIFQQLYIEVWARQWDNNALKAVA